MVTIIDFFTDNVALSDGADGESEYLCQCVVMERAELGDMGRSSNSGEFRRLPPRHRIDFLKGVARGLQAAHAVGITHCDVKPSNLLLYREPGEIYAKICDFGAAQSAIRRTTALGTAQYMAPELGSGHQATLMSDIFSLGVTFHELLTGDLPNAKDPYDQ